MDPSPASPADAAFSTPPKATKPADTKKVTVTFKDKTRPAEVFITTKYHFADGVLTLALREIDGGDIEHIPLGEIRRVHSS